MFTTVNFETNTLGRADLVSRALGTYRSLHWRAILHRLVSSLRGASSGLKDLSQEISGHGIRSQHYVGAKTIAINAIHGSEARSNDFDDQFNPVSGHTQARWLSVAVARQKEIPLPPVELIQVGSEYFVRDGHHRISVAHALGEQFIEAEVTQWEVAR